MRKIASQMKAKKKIQCDMQTEVDTSKLIVVKAAAAIIAVDEATKILT